MKIESCRKCGTELEIKQNCSYCSSPTQFHCKKCDIDTEMQIHLNCFQSSFEKEILQVQEAIAN